jgi:hypothetical protein
MHLFTYKLDGKCRVKLSLYLVKKRVKKMYCVRVYRSTAQRFLTLAPCGVKLSASNASHFTTGGRHLGIHWTRGLVFCTSGREQVTKNFGNSGIEPRLPGSPARSPFTMLTKKPFLHTKTTYSTLCSSRLRHCKFRYVSMFLVAVNLKLPLYTLRMMTVSAESLNRLL